MGNTGTTPARTAAATSTSVPATHARTQGVATAWRPQSGIPTELLSVLGSSTLYPHARSQILLVQPVAELQTVLVKTGCLEEVAQYCQVRIDIGAEVGPASRQVLLS